jgi:hypothetical protein
MPLWKGMIVIHSANVSAGAGESRSVAVGVKPTPRAGAILCPEFRGNRAGYADKHRIAVIRYDELQWLSALVAQASKTLAQAIWPVMRDQGDTEADVTAHLANKICWYTH